MNIANREISINFKKSGDWERDYMKLINRIEDIFYCNFNYTEIIANKILKFCNDFIREQYPEVRFELCPHGELIEAE